MLAKDFLSRRGMSIVAERVFCRRLHAPCASYAIVAKHCAPYHCRERYLLRIVANGILVQGLVLGGATPGCPASRLRRSLYRMQRYHAKHASIVAEHQGVFKIDLRNC